jgi:hypothetical protein
MICSGVNASAALAGGSRTVATATPVTRDDPIAMYRAFLFLKRLLAAMIQSLLGGVFAFLWRIFDIFRSGSTESNIPTCRLLMVAQGNVRRQV